MSGLVAVALETPRHAALAPCLSYRSERVLAPGTLLRVPLGRREVPGRPVIYATTPAFLDHFGLASRRDLPGIDELRAAGLLDPVDEAFEDAMRFEPDEPDEPDECDENLAD